MGWAAAGGWGAGPRLSPESREDRPGRQTQLRLAGTCPRRAEGCRGRLRLHLWGPTASWLVQRQNRVFANHGPCLGASGGRGGLWLGGPGRRHAERRRVTSHTGDFPRLQPARDGRMPGVPGGRETIKSPSGWSFPLSGGTTAPRGLGRAGRGAGVAVTIAGFGVRHPGPRTAPAPAVTSAKKPLCLRVPTTRDVGLIT